MDDAFQALADPRRRAILRLLNGTEMSAGDVAAHFDVTRPAISQHLRVLRDSGLIEARAEGTRRLYRIRTEAMAALRASLEEFWQDGLERLAAAAEAEHRDRFRRRRSSGAA